jgi:hypothetical protein
MNIEDIFLKIRTESTTSSGSMVGLNVKLSPFNGELDDPFFQEFLISVGMHIDLEKPLSTKQSEIVLKIIRKVQYHIVKYKWLSQQELDSLLESPVYARPLYLSTHVPKEVRYLGGNLLGFRFKYNPKIAERIRKICDVKKASWFTDDIPVVMESHENITTKPYFDKNYNVWVVPVYRFNIDSIINLIGQERFGKDSEVDRYLKLARNSIDKPSTFIVDTENEVIIANVCDNTLLAGWITEVAEGIAL